MRVKATYLHAPFLRIKARRGQKKAILAVANSKLTAVWHMLSDGAVYADLGTDYFNRLDACRTTQRLLKWLADLGYHPQSTSP